MHTTLTAPLMAQDESLYAEQRRLERRALEDGIDRYRQLASDAIRRGEGSSLKAAEQLLSYWLHPVVESIKEEAQTGIGKGVGKGVSYWYFVAVSLPPEVLGVIALQTVLSRFMSVPSGIKTIQLCHDIGKVACAEAWWRQLRDADKQRAPEHRRLKWVQKIQQKDAPRYIRKMIRKHSGDADVWTQQQAYRTGAWLLSNVMQCCGLEVDGEMTPAFREVYRRVSAKRRTTYILLDGRVYDIIERGHELRSLLGPRYLPMLVPPLPWTTDDEGKPESDGGYLDLRHRLITKSGRQQRRYIAEADMRRYYAGLNAINAPPWRIHEEIARLQQQVYDEGGDPLLYIPRSRDAEKPPLPEGVRLDAPKSERWRDVDPFAKKTWRAKASEVHRGNVQLRAERSVFGSVRYVIETIGGRRFYQPHAADHRGRTYPVPQGLHHQSDDLTRSLMVCGYDRPCSERGERWLAIHLANVFGYDKVSEQEQVDWVNANWDNIERSALNPFGCEWWQQRDDRARGAKTKPWEILAACRAILDPEGEGARLPVQVDGTANALQHFAALARDEELAALVNLVPADKPSDPYTKMLEVVQRRVVRDIEKGKKLRRRISMDAGWKAVFEDWDIPTDLPERLCRQIMKRPTMTKSYSVTKAGAREQVEEEIGLLDLELNEGESWSLASYIADHILAAFDEIGTSSSETMEWLKKCAGMIVDEGKFVGWVTPLGFPVVLNYRKGRGQNIQTAMGCYAIEQKRGRPAKGKTVFAVAPSYVHSIDASHVLMTAAEAARETIWFAHRHDGFLTHAEDMTRMQTILRQQFVELHTQDLLGDLYRQWSKLARKVLPLPPERGEYDVHNILGSVYAFH